MCGEHSPLLGGVIPAYETFVLQWQSLSSSPKWHPQIGAFILEGLPTALKYHKLMRENKMYMYAMCKWYIYLSRNHELNLKFLRKSRTRVFAFRGYRGIGCRVKLLL